MNRKGRLDGLGIVGVAFLIFMILNVLKDQGLFQFGLDQGIPAAAAVAQHLEIPQTNGQNGDPTPLPRIELAQSEPLAATSNGSTTGNSNVMAQAMQAGPLETYSITLPEVISDAMSKNTIDSDAIAPPYKHYFMTQGPHGEEYGHLAIDIAAGKGTPILSPINGWISNLYIDDWGNPSLDIENDHYLIELLHGDYTVKIGDQVTIGQQIGFESNQGDTYDPNGNSCRGRDCGYHTHINIFDKLLGQNVNPLDLIPAQQ